VVLAIRTEPLKRQQFFADCRRIVQQTLKDRDKLSYLHAGTFFKLTSKSHQNEHSKEAKPPIFTILVGLGWIGC
jgi:hypothetical protein